MVVVGCYPVRRAWTSRSSREHCLSALSDSPEVLTSPAESRGLGETFSRGGWHAIALRLSGQARAQWRLVNEPAGKAKLITQHPDTASRSAHATVWMGDGCQITTGQRIRFAGIEFQFSLACFLFFYGLGALLTIAPCFYILVNLLVYWSRDTGWKWFWSVEWARIASGYRGSGSGLNLSCNGNRWGMLVGYNFMTTPADMTLKPVVSCQRPNMEKTPIWSSPQILLST